MFVFFQTSTTTYFLLHNNSEYVILFNLKQNKKNYRTEKKDIGESVYKTANDDRENDYRNALRPRGFGLCTAAPLLKENRRGTF